MALCYIIQSEDWQEVRVLEDFVLHTSPGFPFDYFHNSYQEFMPFRALEDELVNEVPWLLTNECFSPSCESAKFTII